ncbi:MAG: pyridoxal phosphate-dependent aminotransferase [Pseudomonadota bacterium]
MSSQNIAEFEKAPRLDGIGVSVILQIVARARQLKAQGEPVIVMGAGEPDFPTPDNVKAAAIAAINNDDSHYTALDGTLELKQAVVNKFKRENDLEFGTDEISVSTGAKQVLFNAFMASVKPGDEVIIPTPYWTSYEDIVRICDAKAVTIPCSAENNFTLQAADLEKAITPNTRWLLINSPSNPSGAVYSRDDYLPILDVLRKHPHVWLMTDDIYEHIVYGNEGFVTPAQLAPDLRSRILTVNGVSKAYAMTGWRIGYGAGPRVLIKAMAAVQSQSTSCASSISQAAAVEALNGPQDYLDERREDFRDRRDLVVNALNAMDGIDCREPGGAFYTYASCAGVIGKKTPDGTVIEDDTAFCRLLLDNELVAVVPGSAFGLSPFFRISYATSTEELQEAMQRMTQFVEGLS